MAHLSTWSLPLEILLSLISHPYAAKNLPTINPKFQPFFFTDVCWVYADFSVLLLLSLGNPKSFGFKWTTLASCRKWRSNSLYLAYKLLMCVPLWGKQPHGQCSPSSLYECFLWRVVPVNIIITSSFYGHHDYKNENRTWLKNDDIKIEPRQH